MTCTISEHADRTGNSGRNGRAEVVTVTGWRFVGRAANVLADSVAGPGGGLRPEDIFFGVRFGLRPKRVKADGVQVALSVLGEALSASGQQGIVLERDGSLQKAQDRFHGVHWDTASAGEQWAGRLVWVHPHPVVSGVSCTTCVELVERWGRVEVSVHAGTPGGVAADRGHVGVGQARPAFLDEFDRVAILSFGGGSPVPQLVTEAGMDQFVRRVLLAESREHAVAVLAPVESSRPADTPEYLVPPEQVAAEFLGLAHVYVLDRSATTFALTDALGDRRLSCYRGALRIYMPDFSCADRGMSHPLLIDDRVGDPVERARVLGETARGMAGRVPVQDLLGALRAEATPVPVESKAADIGKEEPASASVPAPPEAPAKSAVRLAGPARSRTAEGERFAAIMGDMGRGLEAKLDELIALHVRLVDEVGRLRTATVVRGANAAGVERRLAQIERLVRDQTRMDDDGADPAARGDAPPTADEDGGADDALSDRTLVAELGHADSEYSDDLLILDSAMASAQDSPYEDVDRVATILKAMAELARRRQEGRLGMSLRDAFSEAGIDYRGGISRSTSRKQREQYSATLPDGRVAECHEHIALGTSYDPRHCLRIYFSSRTPGEPRFVITHVGRHFDVASTT